MRARILVGGVVAALLLPTGRVEGQQPAPSSGSVAADLGECTAAAAAESRERMEAASSRLGATAAAMEASDPVDALVIRARVRTQCHVPFSSLLRRGELVAEANALLERALAMDPRHMVARFALGMNHFHAPAFMGRTDSAVRELERVLRDHGDRTEAVIAWTYLHLGELYERQGRRALSAQTWRRGAERFPSHAGLRAKAGSPGDGAGDPSPRPERAVDPPATALALPPIHVAVSTYSVDDPGAATQMSRLDVYTMPGGTADVFQTFQTLPGVTRVGDSGDLYVRGGDPAETPIYVDGARLFHPGRFETLNGTIFGVFDPSVMRTAYFSSGGFSARYGNAQSGVVALETERRPTHRRWRGGANLVSAGGTVWQPLGERAGVWTTAMLTHAGLLLELHGRSDDYPESPTSRQLMVGVAFEPVYGLELRVGALDVADRTTALISATGYDGPFRSLAGTRLATAEVRASSPDGRALARLTLAASSRDSRFRFGVVERDHEDRQLGARLDGEFERAPITLRTGLEGALLAALTDGTVPAGGGVAPGSPTVRLDWDRQEADHLGGYTEVEWRASRRLALLGGVRADGLPGEAGTRVDPRLAAAYSAGGWTYRVGGGRFSQGRWRTRYALPDAGSPAGVPLRARHLVAGIQRDGAPALRAEAYIKRYDDYVAEHGAAAEAPQVIAGRAAGLDVLVRPQAVGPVVGWLTYSYLHGEVELEDGARLPSRYHVTHTLTAVGKLSAREWELGFAGRYGTGRPYTPVLGVSTTAGDAPPAPLYGALHSQRLPAYLRLDGRLSRLTPLRGGLLATYVEALNLLDRGNVLAYTYDAAYADPQPVLTFFGNRTFVLGVEARF
jgi:vitamin B12 transporter